MTDRERAAAYLDGYVTKSGGKIGGWDALLALLAASRAEEREKYVTALRLAVEALEWQRDNPPGAQPQLLAALAACRKVVE